MWIRVQGEKMLVEPKIIEVSKGILKKSKYTILGRITGNTQEFGITLGSYDSEEIANRVFDEIEQGLLSGREFYVMPDPQGM